MPVEVQWEDGEAALVGEDVANSAGGLAAVTELRPDLCDRRVEGDRTALNEHQHRDGGDGLRRREPEHPPVLGVAEAEVERELSVPVDGDLCTAVPPTREVRARDLLDASPAGLGQPGHAP